MAKKIKVYYRFKMNPDPTMCNNMMKKVSGNLVPKYVYYQAKPGVFFIIIINNEIILILNGIMV